MTNQANTAEPRNANFGEWLKSFITFKITSNGKGIKLLPKWLLLGLLALSYAVKYIGQESEFWVFMEFVIVFLFGGLIWYGFDRLRGKAKI